MFFTIKKETYRVMTMQLELKRKLETVFNEKQSSVLAEVINDAYSDLVKTSDFNELKGIVKELAEAQKSSEKRLTRLEVTVSELAEAQKESEKRLTRLEITVSELAEAQKESEKRLTRLEVTVSELAEAQKESEKRLTRLEVTVSELAEAQRKTEEELRELVQEHKKTRQQLGGLSATVGYVLENDAYKGLPGLLKRDYEVVITSRLKRQFVKDNKGNYIEINIFGEASQAGNKVFIIGEGKSQLSKKGVDEFIRKKLKRVEGVYTEIFPLLITHMISESDVEEYAKNKGIVLYYSYDF
jgi:myosin heavy subunit